LVAASFLLRVIFRRRPPMRPLFRAASRPALVRSAMRSRFW